MNPAFPDFPTLSPPCILLVEDNYDILNINRIALERCGYKVLCAATLREAETLLAQEPQLIILDIMMPDGSGLDFCRKVRMQSDVPILFLTALGENKEVVTGLAAGGDDYLVKPYDLEVLEARVQALLRRARPADAPSELQCGPLRLDVMTDHAYLNGKDLLLTQKEFALLLLFVKNVGKLLTKEAVYQKVWNQPLAQDSKALYMTVSRLKKKLAAAEVLNLTVYRGKGYCFYCRDQKRGKT